MWAVEIDAIFVNTLTLVLESIDLSFVWVVELDLLFVWVTEIDLVFVCGPKMTWFLCGE